MSLSGLSGLSSIPASPVSSGHRSATPSPTLSSKTLAANRPLTSAVNSSSTRPQLSPAMKASSSLVLIPPMNLPQPSTNHSRSLSLPSLQQRQSPRPTEYPVTLVRDHAHSSSAANLLAQRRETIFTAQQQQYTAYFPVSPRLRPVMSPGPVTPMQLEEDLEYFRFPSSVSTSTTPIRSSPLVMPVSVMEEENEGDTIILEMPNRNR